MNPTQLAGLIKRAYPNFNMTNFDCRLKLQKFVYLIQASSLNLGYDFRLYLHGPYATLLARDGFDMPEFSEVQRIKFEDTILEENFLKLLRFLSDKKDDAEIMEIISSIHLFHKLYPDKSEEEIIRLVEEKSPKFEGKEETIKTNLERIKEFELIQW